MTKPYNQMQSQIFNKSNIQGASCAKLSKSQHLDYKFASHLKKVLPPQFEGFSGILTSNHKNQQLQNVYGSIGEYINLQIQHPKMLLNLLNPKKYFCSKNRIKNKEIEQSLKQNESEAMKVLMNQSRRKQDKTIASKVIAQSLFGEIYGKDIIRADSYPIRQLKKPKNLINMSILEDIMNEMVFNPRSHSILLRKQELDKLKQELNDSGQKRSDKRKPTVRLCFDVEKKIEMVYFLKNQYMSLKNIIIPTKCDQYEYFLTLYSQQNKLKTIRQYSLQHKDTMKKTFVLTEPSRKTDKYSSLHFEKKVVKNSCLQTQSKFEQSDELLVMENVVEIHSPMFMYIINKCKFQILKVVKLRMLRIMDDLIFLFLDCLKNIGCQTNVMDSIQFSSISLQNVVRFSEKISLLLEVIPVKMIRFQSIGIETRSLSKLAVGIAKNIALEQIHLRFNKIDILGIRQMEMVCKNLRRLKLLDARNNDIPHYANLKDKNPLILFF